MKDSVPFARLLSREDLKKMPWQNGRGVTHEIARRPQDAKLEHGSLAWRLSVAPISEPGPFSSFPGLERMLSLVEGKGLRLLRDGHSPTNLRPGDVYLFAGGDSVISELPHGPVADLGLLYDARRVKAEMQSLDFKSRARSFRLSTREAFFYVTEGDFEFSCYPGGPEGKMRPGQVLGVGELAAERIVVFEPRGKKNTEMAMVAVELDWT